MHREQTRLPDLLLATIGPCQNAVEPRGDGAVAGNGGSHSGRRRVCVGVMPLQPIGTVNLEEWDLATGLAREISTALSRFRSIHVVSSDAPMQPAAGQRDDAPVRSTIEVDLLIDGSMQKVGDRLRINVRLLDLRADNQVIWARGFNSQVTNLFALQNEVAAEVAAQIEAEFIGIEARRRRNICMRDKTAYDLVSSAIAAIRSMEYGAFIKAGDSLARAITLESQYAIAYGWYAYWHTLLVGQGWASNPQRAIIEAGELAEWAVMLDPLDAMGLAFAGHVWARLQHRPREAIGLHEAALSLNPNLPTAWALSAIAHAYIGEAKEAERRNNRYKRLSPLDPNAFIFDGYFTTIYLLQRNYELAAAYGHSVMLMNPLLADNFKPYLAALGHLGRTREAEMARWRLQAAEPDFTIKRFLATTPLSRRSDRRHFAEGLRRAGVPESAS